MKIATISFKKRMIGASVRMTERLYNKIMYLNDRLIYILRKNKKLFYKFIQRTGLLCLKRIDKERMYTLMDQMDISTWSFKRYNRYTWSTTHTSLYEKSMDGRLDEEHRVKYKLLYYMKNVTSLQQDYHKMYKMLDYLKISFNQFKL